MIHHPHIGQRVRLHYSKAWQRVVRIHGREAVVRVVPRGPGPRNVGVEIDGGMVVVPRGNLVEMGGAA